MFGKAWEIIGLHEQNRVFGVLSNNEIIWQNGAPLIGR